jgi:lipopolysaccharide transport system ATP-binding protein
MGRPTVRVEGIGKEYVIGGRESGPETFREMLASATTAPLRRWRRLGGMAPLEERIWALRDVSFEVNEGEVVGIIGRNGAGKSTLLKILSRITEPTEGRVEIRGRVASLLEVGTGFHPELTGRENVYLNGAVLGMTRREIARKFEEIVDFAGVEKFLDTPVKRYSSGMYVRLAFAVAAHLEPEVLLVDEVLAVGDGQFQKKCLGKISEVAGGGRTVLFVSHNLGAVASLCTRAILLADGRLSHHGEVRETLNAYFGDQSARNILKGRQIHVSANLDKSGGAIVLSFEISLVGPLQEPRLGIGINDNQGRRITTLFSEMAGALPPIPRGETLRLRIETEPVRLSPGWLWIKISLAERGRAIEVYDDAFRIPVPDYCPFVSPPHVRPAGALMIVPQLLIKETVSNGSL